MKPNIILILLDAVRPDHLSCYGHTRKVSPTIDALARSGTLFENCFAIGC
jgi:arylsulfatase A-like enzyme